MTTYSDAMPSLFDVASSNNAKATLMADCLVRAVLVAGMLEQVRPCQRGSLLDACPRGPRRRGGVCSSEAMPS